MFGVWMPATAAPWSARACAWAASAGVQPASPERNSTNDFASPLGRYSETSLKLPCEIFSCAWAGAAAPSARAADKKVVAMRFIW